ncbi:MAG: YHS domain-containing protein [Candidatus Zapsychrus exili]|nr:YHS domain-containing protein [Candidatus Zapsychrus exili]
MKRYSIIFSVVLVLFLIPFVFAQDAMEHQMDETMEHHMDEVMEQDHSMHMVEEAEEVVLDEAVEGEVAVKESIIVGNKVCPVMGAEVVEEYATKAEYNGKIYSLCCFGCLKAFNEDPDKYVKIIEESMQAEE